MSNCNFTQFKSKVWDMIYDIDSFNGLENDIILILDSTEYNDIFIINIHIPDYAYYLPELVLAQYLKSNLDSYDQTIIERYGDKTFNVFLKLL